MNESPDPASSPQSDPQAPGAQLRVCCVFRAQGPGPVTSVSDFPAHPSVSRNVTTGATAWSTSQGLRHSQALPSAAIPPPRLSSARDGSTREVLPSALPQGHPQSCTELLKPRDCQCRADVTQRCWGHPSEAAPVPSRTDVTQPMAICSQHKQVMPTSNLSKALENSLEHCLIQQI